jgi:RNA methyltransferase, TrmH family
MITKSQIKFLKSLHLKKYRKEHQVFLVQGEKSVLELLSSTFEVKEIYCTENFAQKHHIIIQSKKYHFIIVKEKELQQIGTLDTNENVVAVAETKLSNDSPVLDNEYALVLDNIQDPGNMGTIIRVADWYAIPFIICSEDTVDVYNPKVIAATMGSFLRVQVYYTDLEHFLKQENHLHIYGAVLNGENLHQTTFAKSGLIVMGNESKGISPTIQNLLTHKITIPRFGSAESLNVAMATTAICDNLRRQGSKY